MEKGIDVFKSECQVFEYKKYSEIYRNGGNKSKLTLFILPVPVNDKSENPVNEHRAEHQKDIYRLAPRIEKYT